MKGRKNTNSWQQKWLQTKPWPESIDFGWLDEKAKDQLNVVCLIDGGQKGTLFPAFFVVSKNKRN